MLCNELVCLIIDYAISDPILELKCFKAFRLVERYWHGIMEQHKFKHCRIYAARPFNCLEEVTFKSTKCNSVENTMGALTAVVFDQPIFFNYFMENNLTNGRYHHSMLLSACQYGRLEILKNMTADMGFFLDERDNDPILKAINRKDSNTLKVLWQSKRFILHRRTLESITRYYVCMNDLESLLEFWNGGYEIEESHVYMSIINSADYGNIDMFMEVIKHMKTPSRRDHAIKLALKTCASSGRDEILKYIVEVMQIDPSRNKNIALRSAILSMRQTTAMKIFSYPMVKSTITERGRKWVTECRDMGLYELGSLILKELKERGP